jgi:flagellar protein FliO/FliZ
MTAPMAAALMAASVVMMALPGPAHAASIFVSEVRATREPGHLRVEVLGDGAIDPELAHAQIEDGRLFLFLGGTRVHADNRNWDLADGSGSVEAHRHHGHTELVIPLERNGCAGPVELASSETGLTALVGCGATRGAVASGQGARAASLAPTAVGVPVRTPARREGRAVTGTIDGSGQGTPGGHRDDGVATTPPARPRAPVVPTIPPGTAAAIDVQREREPSAERDTLAALVALPGPAPRPAALPAAPLLTSPSAPPTLALVGPAAQEGASAPQLPALATVAVASAASPEARAGGLGAAEEKRAGVLLPGVALAALALGAYLFARRRKGGIERHIQIVETASLGPRRTLVMARIGGETLLLGTSEAGITLLKSDGRGAESRIGTDGREAHASSPLSSVPLFMSTSTSMSMSMSGSTSSSAPAPDTCETDVPIFEALADIPDPRGAEPLAPVGGAGSRSGFRSIEGGLASLFGRVASGRRTSSGPVDGEDTGRLDVREPGDRRHSATAFDDILEDSIEDQELRRKLAAGLSARAR